MYELHFTVPVVGDILCTLNSRLDAAMVSVLPDNLQAKILLADCSKSIGLALRKKNKIANIVFVNYPDSSSMIDITPENYKYEKLNMIVKTSTQKATQSQGFSYDR
ncbi:hypothetical protein TSUD_192290 [Trifolium subterraneum]|uniref:Uncharacterized protein n=1 Tax=Trifolium subterraneum TaxID=3900 RepID=A0A2Z6PDX2_TRISU|nr:hypothetical protein TSUD_192290 [Trifolium subterraneum]